MITSRGKTVPAMIDNAKEILKRENIEFNKYYWQTIDKAQICKMEKIDIMIDDSIRICEKVANIGIKAIYMRDSNMRASNHPNIKEVYTWGELYRYMKDEVNL